MIFLDTHIVVWLYAGLIEKFSVRAAELIEDNNLYISNMVRLELQYLYEIGRLTEKPDVILDELSKTTGLQVHPMKAKSVFDIAMIQSWTRDVFDRLITAEAITMDTFLITKDKKILANYNKAVWL